MTRGVIETAVAKAFLSQIQMADGKEYEVQTQAQIAFGKSCVIFVGKDDLPHVLPLLTITGLSYLKPPGERAA